MRRRLRLLSRPQRRNRGGHRRQAALLLTPCLLVLGQLSGGATGALSPRPAAAADDFGRWEHRPARCEVQGRQGGADPSPSHPCVTLILDQQAVDILAIRFISGSSTLTNGTWEIRFVGRIEAGSRPLQCHQGRCHPEGQLDLRVSAVARSGFDGRGLATGVPRSHLAEGSCSLRAGRMHCEARSRGGGRWRADARL